MPKARPRDRGDRKRFRDAPLIAPDHKHSIEEERLIAIGHAFDGRPLFVAFVFRERQGKRLIRPISARYMHQKERDAYDA